MHVHRLYKVFYLVCFEDIEVSSVWTKTKTFTILLETFITIILPIIKNYDESEELPHMAMKDHLHWIWSPTRHNNGAELNTRDGCSEPTDSKLWKTAISERREEQEGNSICTLASCLAAMARMQTGKWNQNRAPCYPQTEKAEIRAHACGTIWTLHGMESGRSMLRGRDRSREVQKSSRRFPVGPWLGLGWHLWRTGRPVLEQRMTILFCEAEN